MLLLCGTACGHRRDEGLALDWYGGEWNGTAAWFQGRGARGRCRVLRLDVRQRMWPGSPPVALDVAGRLCARGAGLHAVAVTSTFAHVLSLDGADHLGSR